MLGPALDATGIDPTTAAKLLGIDPELLEDWVSGRDPLPHSMASLLSAVIGIDLSQVPVRSRATSPADTAPAIWYRLRDERLTQEDREYIFLIRQLGYFIHQLEAATATPMVGWKTLFQEIRDRVNKQAGPRAQGRQAAAIFRENRGLNSGATGIGGVIRPNLRSMGIVIVESPIKGTPPATRGSIDGCCFYIGGTGSERPCVFANSYGSTWFRRNSVIMHEVAHAIFDADALGAALDFSDGTDDVDDFAEERADAFALEVMAPARTLRNVAQRRGIRWDTLDAESLTRLVADVEAEKAAILHSALADGLISEEQFEYCSRLDLPTLPTLSSHALTAREFIKQAHGGNPKWTHKSVTSIPSRRLRLPPLYIQKVVSAFTDRQISRGKAAAMLMIDENKFSERFRDAEDQLAAVAD